MPSDVRTRLLQGVFACRVKFLVGNQMPCSERAVVTGLEAG